MKKSRLRTLLIVGGIAAGLIVACIAGMMLSSTIGGRASYSLDGAGGDHLALERSYAPQAVEMVMEKEESPVEGSASDASSGQNIAFAAERLIIRNGNISMIVEDTRDTQATIVAMINGLAGEGAFVVSVDEYGATEGDQPHISMSIRVPVTRFDDTMDKLAELAIQVTSRNESAQDVTEEYVDLGARLESLEAARERLLEIMAEAQTTKDLLEAEQQLTQRESEIESIKGRMQYLEQSARLSNIWIDLQPDILKQPVGDQWRPAETVRRAVDALVDGLQGFVNFLIFFAIAVLPWLAGLGVAIYLIVVIVRWRRRAGRARRGAVVEEEETQSTDS